MITQLKPAIPVHVVGKGSAECVGWIDYSGETDLLWICFLDLTGESWIVPNSEIRALPNYSLGRRFKVDLEIPK